MNAFTAVRYMREILRNSTGDKVLVDRDQLRAVVIAAERSSRFAREQRIAKRLTNAPADVGNSQLTRDA